MDKVVIAPCMNIYKNVFPKEMQIIDRLEGGLSNSNGRYGWSRAQVGVDEVYLDHRNCFDFKYRKSDLGPIDQYNLDLANLYDDIYKVIRECLDDYSRDYHINLEYIEAFNMVKYGVGEKFGYHGDDGDPYRCTTSLVGYINDDYVGGEIDFKFFNLKVKPDAGDLVIFPSSYAYLHASLPVEEGNKYVVVIMTDRHEEAHKNDSYIYRSR